MLRIKSQTLIKGIYSGLINGAIAWTIYGVVECFFSTIVPWLIQPGYKYIQVHWGFTALLFALYPVIGLILGGLFGLGHHMATKGMQIFHEAQSAILFRAAGTFTVILIFVINLTFQYPMGLSILFLFLISMLLVLVQIVSVWSIIWDRHFDFISNPWTTNILLLGLSWITLDQFGGHPKAIKAGLVLSFLIAILLISFFVIRIANKHRYGRSDVAGPASLFKSNIYLAFSVLLVFIISLFARQAPLQMDSGVRSLAMDANYPNVILIVMDTVRADNLSLYGYERDTTPHLKEFSKNATLYSNAIAPCDMTLCSHASIFTGLYARQHGAHYDPWNGYRVGRPLDEKFNTLAEILLEKGYLTMAVVANDAYLSYIFQMNQGFYHFDQREPIEFLGIRWLDKARPAYLREAIHKALDPLASYIYRSHISYRRAGLINKEVFTLLDKVKKNDKRFFLFVNYMDAHVEYIPPSPFDSFYPGKDKSFNWDCYDNMQKEVMAFKLKVTEKEHNHLLSQYDGGIAYIDYNIWKLIGRLKELGVYEDSLIIITSDHGETFGKRNLLGHGVSVYQNQVHVPLVIKYPKEHQKVVVDDLVNGVDILSTVLDVLGYKIPDGIQGQSLLKLKSRDHRSVISESFPGGYLIDLHSRFNRIERAIFSGPYKFISSTAGKRELYSLSKDPKEKENLYRENDEVSKEYESRLDQWLRLVKAETGPPAKLDKEALDRLKALGYVQ